MRLKYLSFLLVTAVLQGCQSMNFYQVYNVESSKGIVADSQSLVYEDENCRVLYNLWGNGGNVSFSFYNKTDSDIYLDMGKCFFILNDIAYPYFQNRTYSVNDNKSQTKVVHNPVFMMNASTAISDISSKGISYTEEKKIYIPSKSKRLISEFKINTNLIRDCDLYRYPNKKEIKSLSYSQQDSPITFRNRLSYVLGHQTTARLLENTFYVSKVTNFPESEVITSEYVDYCEQKGVSATRSFNEVAPNKFYIKYSKSGDTYWKH